MKRLYTCKDVLLAYLLVALVYPHYLEAQNNHVYSLQALVALAEKYTPSIRQSEAFANAATANVTIVKHEALPFVKFNAQASLGSANSVNGNYFPMGIVPSTSGSIDESQTFQPVVGDLAVVYSEYDFYNFGLTKARNHVAEAEAALGKAALARDKYQLKINLAKLYFDILTYQNLQEIDEHNVDRYNTITTIIQALTHAGIKPGSDLSQANAELANANIALNKTKTQLQESLEAMSAYTGVSVDSLNINSRILDSSSVYNNLAYDTMETNNPILNYYKSNNDFLATNAVLLKKSYLPKFTLISSFWGRAGSLDKNLDYNALYTGLGFQRFNYAVGIAFVYDFMDPLHRKDKLAEYKYEMTTGEEAYNQQVLNFRKASDQADLQLKLVLNNLQLLTIQRKSARAVFLDKQAQYKAGMVTLIDLTNANFILYRALVNYLNAIDDWYAANLSKAIVTGNLDNFIQSVN